uniref:Shugoshin C-terminal domain-containing protein n=1 Tax=Pygocentrus nattereri TaxID=42514 RepID=A0A3B4CD99_PYGNA
MTLTVMMEKKQSTIKQTASKIKTKIHNTSSFFKLSLKTNNKALALALVAQKQRARQLEMETVCLQKNVQALRFELAIQRHKNKQMVRTSLKKTLLGWQHMLLQNLYVPFNINGAFRDVQVTHAMGTNTPPHHQRCWLLNFALITIRTVLFLFGPEDTTSMISKNNLKCGLIRPQDTFPLCVSPSQMSLGPEKPAAFLGVVDIWLLLCVAEF